MSGLEIGHGNPWWLSPNVWVVPADDSSEPSPGVLSPVVGTQYFATANVTNTSSANILDATVYFWWANPSLGILTSVNATLIGTSSVSVNAGQTANTLELVPWTPSFVNGGHECIIAAVVLGNGPPPAVLDGSGDPTVAQHNLGVIQMTPHMHGRFHYPFQLCNTARVAQHFTVTARPAPLAEAERFLTALHGKAAQAAHAGKLEHLGFLSTPCPDHTEHATARPSLEEIRLAPFSCTGFTLVGQLAAGTALIHVVQRSGDRVVGGLSILVIAQKEAGQ